MLSTKNNRYDGTNFVTGMRALAALGVVFIHTGGLWFRDWGEAGNRIADLGASGVYVFFVISGFAVSESFSRAPAYGSYLKKRLNRIVPLYFFWLAICALVIGLPNVGLYSALMHLSFLSFLDYRVANSIIGVEWTIPIEVFFYLLIPLVLMKVRSLFWLFVLAGTAFLAHRFVYNWLAYSGIENGLLALHWSPIPYAFSFMLGVVAFRIRTRWRSTRISSDVVFISSAATMLAFVLAPSLFHPEWLGTLTVVSILTFAVICAGADTGVAASILRSPIAQFVGQISYGLYLSHYPIFRWVVEPLALGPVAAFFLTLALAICVSTATWLSIEKIRLRERPTQRVPA